MAIIPVITKGGSQPKQTQVASSSANIIPVLTKSTPKPTTKTVTSSKPIINRAPKTIVLGDKSNLIEQAQNIISPITNNPVVQKTAKDIYSRIVEEGKKILKQKTGLTPEKIQKQAVQIQKGAEETGKLLQKTPNANLGTKGQKLFKATDTETAAINFISNFPSAMAQSLGQSLELVSTDQGRKRIKTDAKNLPKTMEQVKTHIEKKEWQQAFETAMSNTALTVGLDVAGFIPAGLITKWVSGGVKSSLGLRKTAQVLVKEAIEESAEAEVKAVGKFGFTEKVSGKDLGFNEVVDKHKVIEKPQTTKPVVEAEAKAKEPVVTPDVAQPPIDDIKPISSVNPTGSLFVDYTPEARIKAPLAQNMTTLAKTTNKNPDTMVTIYRGVSKSDRGINPGDFITTDPELARTYGANVISKKVKLGDILDDIEGSGGGEYLYRPGATEELKNIKYDYKASDWYKNYSDYLNKNREKFPTVDKWLDGMKASGKTKSQLTEVYNSSPSQPPVTDIKPSLKLKPKEIVKEEIITKEAKKQPPFASKEAKATQKTFSDELNTISTTAKNEAELTSRVEKSVNSVLEKVKNDRSGLAGVRTSIVKQMDDLAGVTPNAPFKQKYAELQTMLKEGSGVDKVLNFLEDKKNEIDELIKTTPETTKVITKTVEKRVTERPIQKPIGTGEVKKSKLGSRLEAEAIEKELVDTLGDTPEYKRLDLKAQGERAVELVNKDKQNAIDIAMGRKASPSNITPEAVYMAVKKQAIKDGDISLIRELANSPRISEATALGQRIVSLRGSVDDDVVGRINEIIKVREEAFKKRYSGKKPKELSDKVVKDIKKRVKIPDRQQWGQFLSSIEC